MQRVETKGQDAPLVRERSSVRITPAAPAPNRLKPLRTAGFRDPPPIRTIWCPDRFRPVQDQNSLGKPGKIRGECSADVPRPEVRRLLIRKHVIIQRDQRCFTGSGGVVHHSISMACGPNVQLSSIGELA